LDEDAVARPEDNVPFSSYIDSTRELTNVTSGTFESDATSFPEAVPSGMLDPTGVLDPAAAAVAGAGGAGVTDAVVDLTEDGDIGIQILSPDTSSVPADVGLQSARWWQLAVKRLMDVVASAVLLLLLLPLWLTTAAAIRLTSRGSALYVQERIGRGGKSFRMLKFRSMRRDAHESRGDVLHLNQATEPVFKIVYDPRITRVGRVIRKLSIDELPQLVNVLRGQMSLVGPRPPLPDEYETYDERERRRLAVLPGITCIWQTSGRSDLDFDTWVSMDLEYIETWSLRKDLIILLRTIPAVLSGRGAY
jgi:lipopolysaccharide/colanic/teichoic acid biosynthesis glycosyltransferase